MQIGLYFGEYSPDSGGAYTFVGDLLDAFIELASHSQHSYVVLCDPTAVAEIESRISSKNVSIEPVEPRSRLARWPAGLKYYSALFRRMWRTQGNVECLARRRNVDLLWYVGTGAYDCPDIPFIATQWDLQHLSRPYFPEVSAKGVWDDREQFYSYFLRRSAYCVTGTRVGKRQIEYSYQIAESRVRVVPLPTPMFALNAPPSVTNADEKFGIRGEYVFYPAQFWPHKNHANLILAIKWLKEHRGLEIALVLSGSDKGNLSFVQEFARQNGVADKVHFVGFVSREELISLYRRALALTFVSYAGPDNVPPLEAFALGTPVIAAAVDGAQEQLGDAATLVDPSNPQSIGQAIWNLHSDRHQREMLIRAGIDRASSWTSLDYIKRIFEIFDEFSAIRRNWS